MAREGIILVKHTLSFNTQLTFTLAYTQILANPQGAFVLATSINIKKKAAVTNHKMIYSLVLFNEVMYY